MSTESLRPALRSGGRRGQPGVPASFPGWRRIRGGGRGRAGLAAAALGLAVLAAGGTLAGLAATATPALAGLAPLAAATREPPARSPAGFLPLDAPADMELLHARAEIVQYRGRRAVHVADMLAKPGETRDQAGYPLAILPGTGFLDGTIEAEVAGMLRAGADEGARGFIGIAFRVQPHGSRFECFYLRMTNGRADDQVRRNHAVQYISRPGFPWERQRKESPERYESYVDLEPGAWTRLRIEVAGRQARLYVHGASQPTLIVDDLKQPIERGQIALWLDDYTDGYFTALRATERRRS
jgi:hypothetical protein